MDGGMSSGIAVNIDFRLFFDRDAVIRQTEKAKRKNLAQAGGFTRLVARRSIRKRKRVSTPGQPPSSHQGDYRRSIFFAYEPHRDSVVIGPRADYGSRTTNPTVPEMLEFGGVVRRGGQTRRYRARPHMGPALEQAEERFARL